MNRQVNESCLRNFKMHYQLRIAQVISAVVLVVVFQFFLLYGFFSVLFFLVLVSPREPDIPNMTIRLDRYLIIMTSANALSFLMFGFLDLTLLINSLTFVANCGCS